MNCHGCDGRGWVDSKVIGPTVCPICKGQRPDQEKPQNNGYDQDTIWTELRKGTPDSFEKILDNESKKLDGCKGKEVLVHLLFDRDVVPHGNIIFHHLQNQTMTGGKVPQLSQDEIVARNYSVSGDGEIRTWEGVPISPQIWSLTCLLSRELRKFKLDANRKGNPCFCDENMLAISIVPESDKDALHAIRAIDSLLRDKHSTEIVNFSLHLLP